ncbi:MAG: phenylalanine--tRNA ligase subunit beta [Gemmatimonadetes bacterium]|nr:phenylalanine--tRNA ligase subunit beta [Gemmatimonadota bacterium]
MNVSRRWLEGFLRRDLDTADTARRLVMLGAGVDAVEALNPGLDRIVVGYVESVRPHPNADRLRLCLVHDGAEGMRNVVCGAPNVTAGKKYPFARIGVTIPGGITLERRKIRGESSEGMLCSARELGLGQDHDGILELDTDAAPGTPLLEVLPVSDDRFVLDVTPNRPDLLGHKGVARELAASLGVPYRLPEIPGATGSGLASLRRVHEVTTQVDGVTVGTEDVAGCARFTGVVVRGVKVGPSPAWLARRLEAVGARSINNVVDATNWVMLELNHPMHAYDLAKVRGHTVVARRARAGEKVTTLDGVERTLTADMTVIADWGGAVGVGGVMGAANTEVSEATTDLLLECAWFEPARIRRTRRALGLSTDASYRFERGVDLWGLAEAQRRCVELILATAGGQVTDAVDVWPEPTNPPRIFLRVPRVAQVLGAELSVAQIEKYLVALGCTVLNKPDDSRLAVDVPGWRPDLVEEIDLIEELARLHGYDTFPIDLRPFRVGQVTESALDQAITRVRAGMVGQGLYEANSLPLGPAEGEDAVKLLNPLSAEEAYLRQSVLAGLVRAVEVNWSRQVRDVRLFEVGTVFRNAAEGGRPGEASHLAAVLTGARAPAHWTTGGKGDDFDMWDLESLFRAAVALANPSAKVQVDAAGWLALSPEGRKVGHARRLELALPAWAAPVFGLELEVAGAVPSPVRYQPLPSTPAAWRDVNLLLGPATTAEAVITAMRAAGGELLEGVGVQSEFRSEALGAERRAVQFRLTFRAPDRTVRDEEVDDLMGRILGAVEQSLDAKLRTS